MSDKPDKKPFTEEDRPERDGPPMDNPEQFTTDKQSIQDMFEEQQTVDSIPLEDLKQDERDERNEHMTKHSSSTEQKYEGGRVKEAYRDEPGNDKFEDT